MKTAQTTAHTPGPWFSDDRGRIFSARAGKDQDGRPLYSLARIHPLPDAEGTMEANTRLIAAAPELLAALNMTVHALEQFRCEITATDGWSVFQVARTAIAKATQ